MRHNPHFGIMGAFMERRPVPIDGLEEGLGQRDLHIVVRGHVEGAAAADAEVNSRRFDQRLDPGLDHAGLRRGRSDYEILRQTFALSQVEDGKAFQEWIRLRFFAGLLRALLLVVGNEAVGIDDGGAALALADVAAERQRLPKREPALNGETVLDCAFQGW
jgi:hypothetical protein